MKSPNGDHKEQGTEQSPRRDDAHTQHQQFFTHYCLSTVQVCTVYPKVLSFVLFPPPQNGCSCVLRSGLDKQRPEELKMTTGTPGLPFPSLLVLWLKLKPNSKEICLKIKAKFKRNSSQNCDIQLENYVASFQKQKGLFDMEDNVGKFGSSSCYTQPTPGRRSVWDYLLRPRKSLEKLFLCV